MEATSEFKTKRYSTKETAAALRKDLRNRWPGAKFSVRMATGTAYGWLDVSWTDGPNSRDVDTACRGYESSRFDGMDDAYHRVEATMYMIDGEPAVIEWGSCGINTHRAYSSGAKRWASEIVARDPGRYESPYDNPGSTYYAEQRVLDETDLTGVKPQSA